MKEFFNWLSTPGPFEELIVLFILIILLLFIAYLIRKVSIEYKGLRVTQNGNDKNENKTANETKPEKNNTQEKSDNTVLGAKISLLATQDYRIISLIIQAHANRIREEMKQYCSINGLDKKSRDSYMVYVDEKKNLYISELKEMFNREYVSYDILSVSDIYEIIEETKESIMNKLEKLYVKLRDISIDEHAKINKSKKELFDFYLNKAIEWRNKEYKSEEDMRSILEEYLNQYNKTCENLTINERIDILNKQLQKIDASKKDLVDIFLTEVVKKMNAKYK